LKPVQRLLCLFFRHNYELVDTGHDWAARCRYCSKLETKELT